MWSLEERRGSGTCGLRVTIESAGHEDRWSSGKKPHGRKIPKPWPGSPCPYDANSPADHTMSHHTLRSAGSPIARLRENSWWRNRGMFCIIHSEDRRVLLSKLSRQCMVARSSLGAGNLVIVWRAKSMARPRWFLVESLPTVSQRPAGVDSQSALDCLVVRG